MSQRIEPSTEEIEVSACMLKGTTMVNMAAFGHDSEFFLWDTKTQKVVPSYRYYKQQKDASDCHPWDKAFKKRYVAEKIISGRLDWYGNPLPDEKVRTRPSAMLSQHVTKIYRDGLAVEVGVSPLRCRAYMWNDTKFTLLKYEPPKMTKNIIFTTRPWVEIDEKLMKTFPDDLKILGCSPSRNAYVDDGMVEQEIHVDPMKTFFRTCGSHLHMSFGGFSAQRRIPPPIWSKFIILTDLCIGVPFTYLFGDELEAKRRTLYGKAGEFRFQPNYGGLEYRSLSSRLWDHPATYSFFTGIWKSVLGGGAFSKMVKAFDPVAIKVIPEAINAADPKLCEPLLPLAQTVINAGGGQNYFSMKEGWSLKAVLDFFRSKREEGVIKDCSIWSEPWAREGHTGFRDYAMEWKLPGHHGRPE